MIDHKVVFQLSDNNEQAGKSLIKQIGNVRKAIPSIRIEVAAHGAGVDFLLEDVMIKNILLELSKAGIRFLACQNTLIEQDIALSRLIPGVEIIPSGIAYIIIRQKEGWSYIKAGL